MPTNTTQRLAQLRSLLEEYKVDAYVIPSADAHGSEYVAEADKRRAFISGFTGSAGTAVVLRSGGAYMFTDGRYWIQSRQEMDDNWILVKVGAPGQVNWDAWLKQNAQQEERIGINPKLFDYGTITTLEASGLTLVTINEDLVDKVWTSKPARSQRPVIIQELEYAGQPSLEKLRDIKDYIRSSTVSGGASHFIVSTLPDIAWILNLRGFDIPFNPVFEAYLLIADEGETTLFIDTAKVTSDVSQYLIEGLKVSVKDYNEIWTTLEEVNWDGKKALATSEISWAISQSIGQPNLAFVAEPSPIVSARAIKNATELEGFRNGYLRDAVSWVRWSAALEKAIKRGDAITEWEAAERLTQEREKNDLFMGLAYENISATNENAALPHYQPSEQNSRVIDRETPYLNDSGAQYRDCTIDTTRTVHFGKPTKEQKRAFTRVLQGHIAIDTAIFPQGTTGHQLDSWARRALWQDFTDYSHGTGHGFGSFLNVHEGPQGFTTKSRGRYDSPILLPGHPITNEPGFYLEGFFGIRTESALAVQKKYTDDSGHVYLGFERLTAVPIAHNLVDFSLMSLQEAKWLFAHNKLCLQKVMPYLGNDVTAKRWLRKQTKFPLFWSWRCS